MQANLNQQGQDAVADIAQRHGFGVDAVTSMLQSVAAGHGSMAQFSHPEFGGSGQWMRGGMTMVSDMFNDRLKGRVDALCNELSALVAQRPDVAYGRHDGAGTPPPDGHGGGQRSGVFGQPTSRDWWPDGLHSPGSTGSQNGMRYAVFADQRRLAVDANGRVTVYDTGDHRIGGVSQQQSGSGTVRFTSQQGDVDLSRLPVVSG